MATSRDIQRLNNPNVGYVVGEGAAPRDPAQAGFVGKRRAVLGAAPDPDGSRAERRAWAKALRKSKKS